MLSRTEIEQLTGRKKASAQVRALREMAGQLAQIGLVFVVRPDGKPVVLERPAGEQVKSTDEPDWSAMDATP